MHVRAVPSPPRMMIEPGYGGSIIKLKKHDVLFGCRGGRISLSVPFSCITSMNTSHWIRHTWRQGWSSKREIPPRQVNSWWRRRTWQRGWSRRYGMQPHPVDYKGWSRTPWILEIGDQMACLSECLIENYWKNCSKAWCFCKWRVWSRSIVSCNPIT